MKLRTYIIVNSSFFQYLSFRLF